MRIIKQLNNNIVIAADEQGQESVLMGKGIGFGAKPGTEADLSKVEKRFVGMSCEAHTRQLAELLERIPTAHLELGMEIARLAQERIGKPLNETLVLMLSDHVSFALEREKKGMHLDNALLWEIRKFYPDEYKIGLDALNLIERETGVALPEDEAGFLAMHVVNAQYGDGVPVAQDILGLIQGVVSLVRYTYGIELDEDSLDYIRFVTHLKFFLARVIHRQALDGSDELYRIVSVMYPKAAACAQKISDYLGQKLDCTLGLEEQSYLIIHIEKLTRK